MLSCAVHTSKQRWSLRQLSAVSPRLSSKLRFSILSEAKVRNSLDAECEDCLPWLERKAGAKISWKLYVGKSSYGRSLFASKNIKTGDCILRIPFSVQIHSDLLPNIKSLLDGDIGNVAKLAIVILVKQKIGRESEWAPYLSCLPQPGQMHNTIFWSKSELDMIRQSSLYQETIKQKAQIENDFITIKPALEQLPDILGSITYKDFIHAYALVQSRAWGSTYGVSMIPFADFLNHDGVSGAVVVNDEDKQVSEVIADRNYAPHEEVLIRYGKFSNATLLLDFGFTLPHNNHDQVKIQMDIPHHDFLRKMKLDILQRHHIPTIKDDNGFNSSKDSFIIKEVRCPSRKGKGLPQSLRAFARVLCCTSSEDLVDLTVEAEQNDGRLARRPIKNISKEIRAHKILFTQITQIIEEYNASIKSLEPVDIRSTCKKFALRRQMALDLLTGELRVLKSASEWLKNYCATLSKKTTSNELY